MKKITMLGQAVLAASIIAAPVAIMNAATASAQPTPAPADVCFDGPYPSPHRRGAGNRHRLRQPGQLVRQLGLAVRRTRLARRRRATARPGPQLEVCGPGLPILKQPELAIHRTGLPTRKPVAGT